VSQWLKRGREQGIAGLRRHPAPGRQPRRTAEQLVQLPALLEAGAQADGFRGQIWACQRVAEVNRQTYGVSYHPAHVSRLLHAAHHSVQRPRAPRNEAAIQAWWRERWPALEKKPPRKAAPSSGEISRASTSCPWRCGPGRRADRGAVRADARPQRATHS
jgi:transposase